MILSFGMNNQNHMSMAVLQRTFSRMLGAAKDTFPNAVIMVPRINYSEELPERVLRELNNIIDESGRGITHLPYNKFQTEKGYGTQDCRNGMSYVESLVQLFKLDREGHHVSQKTSG